jgi:flap endonuclease-1
MGIHNLNRFLLDNCTSESINKKHMKFLSDKTIVVDTSIYLYKFTVNNLLIENMYLLISIFKHYNITPIFVFDGKPPDEKKQIIKKRLIEKIIAEKKYNDLKDKINMVEYAKDKKELEIEIDSLKKQFIRIKDSDIKSVKELMDYCNVIYYDAPGEADQLCAKLVIDNIAWACLSDDMDMFVYGCTRIIRHISLLNHTVIFYNINNIFRELKMSMKDFREIMVISGTDYNIYDNTNLDDTMKHYSEYKENYQNNSGISFYEWLYNNTTYIKNYESLKNIYNIFDVSKIDIPEICKSKIKININNSKLIEFLKPYGFIFV